MSFFQEIEGDSAVIIEGGIFYQVPLYQRDGFLFVKHRGGFVRLMADGSTSKASGKLRLDFLTTDETLCRDRLGRLCTADRGDATPLTPDVQQKLIGGS